MRFGIEMSTDHTLEEVGKQFDVTRERHTADRGQGDCASCGSLPASRKLLQPSEHRAAASLRSALASICVCARA